MEKYLVRDWLSGNGQKGKKMVDLINRQEAIDILELGAEILRRVLDDMEVVGIDREKYSYGLKLIESNIEDIKELPSAQPERKIGKWIKDKSWSEGAGMGESYGYYWKCDQCNNIVKGDWSQCGDNFCSECGADMI